MKILLDTNIIILREASRIIRPDIGTLFYWIDHLHNEKYIHPLTIQEIQKHKDPIVVNTFEVKLKSYHVLKTEAPESPEIIAVRAKYDVNANDIIDTALLKATFAGRVDALISEDRKVHKKALELGIQDRVFTIEQYLEKVVAENPALVDYKVLAVRREHFGDLDLQDHFFDSFRIDYPGFDKWFQRKAEDEAYVCKGDNNDILAFLYIKFEGEDENYSDLEPILSSKRRLKIGTFKVIANGYKLGERFLKIVFDNAMRRKLEEIYVTIFDHTEDQKRLIDLLLEFGFVKHGVKHSTTGDELVYVRNFTRLVNLQHPSLTYPYISRKARKFIVPIYPAYHTELFPDSLLRTESPHDFIESRAHRNALRKVYVSRSIRRDLEAGDILVFYRTADTKRGPGFHTSVATTIGVVQDTVLNIKSLDQFIDICKRRSVFSHEELAAQWNFKPNSRPFVVNFLYVLSFPNRPNLEAMIELGVIPNVQSAPRGFELLSDEAFQRLVEHSNAEQRFIVD